MGVTHPCRKLTFNPDDLATLRDAALDGQAGIEKFNLPCRKTADDWRRLNTNGRRQPLLPHNWDCQAPQELVNGGGIG